MRVLLYVIFLWPVAVAAGSASAAGQTTTGLAAEGRIIAERWCTACHQVSDDQTVVSDDAPAFASIAARYPGDAGLLVLEGFLADPHPLMPDMSLTRREIRDLVAYIGSLSK